MTTPPVQPPDPADEWPKGNLRAVGEVLKGYCVKVRADYFLSPAAIPLDEARTSDLRNLRLDRGLKVLLQTQQLSLSEGLRGLIEGFVAEHDRFIDHLLLETWPEAGGRNSASPTSIVGTPSLEETATKVLQSRLVQLEKRIAFWNGLSLAGAGAGLGTAVACFGAIFGQDPKAWWWIPLSLAALGTVFAVMYTQQGTRNLAPGTRLALSAMPVVILVLGTVIVFTTDSLDKTPGGAGWLILVPLVVLLIVAFSLVWNNPERHPHGRPWPGETGGFPVAFPSLTTLDRGDGSVDELAFLKARIHDEAARQRTYSKSWAACFIVLGGLAALASGSAGVGATQAGSELSSKVAILAILGGGLTALTTALNPGGRWEQARTLSQACDSLQHEVGTVIRLDSQSLAGHAAREKVEEIAVKFDNMLGVGERTRLWKRP